MRNPRVTPTGAARTFGTEQIIVSKTDLQGRITYANDVFVQVSGYTEEELLGQPHSLIRHPDMPRAVFKELWDTVSAGREIFAYVNNLAADGAHYWVLAHVTPSFGPGGRITGYHSNRRCPEPSAIRAVSALYAQLRDVERQQTTARAAVDAGSRLLHETLDGLGVTYEQFVWKVISDAEGAAA